MVVKESKMYPFVERHLLNSVKDTLSEGNEAESHKEVTMFYGHIRCAADVVVYKWREVDNGEDHPPTRELLEMHVCECKPYLYTYRAYGQLLHYTNILNLYYNSGHFLAYNEDFYSGVRAFWDRNDRFPKFWTKRLESESFERLLPSLKLYLYLVLLYEKKYIEKEELDETLAFHEGCLSAFMDQAIGLLTVYHPSSRVYPKKKPEPIEIKRLTGRKPHSYFEVDEACIVKNRKTWRYCPWFVNGKYLRCPYERTTKCIGSKCLKYRHY